MKPTGPMKLHDRATRGEALTEEEQTLLDAWYREKDREEAALLNGSGFLYSERIQEEFERTLEMVQERSEDIRLLMQENAHIRKEIAELQDRLTRSSSPAV